MQKIYRGLTKDQKKRGVIFSSALVFSDKNEYSEDVKIHEVFLDMDREERNRIIDNLKNDKFFNDSPYKYNIIRQ